MERFPQVTVNIKVSNDKKAMLDSDTDIQHEIQRASGVLGNDGRILVRASGTEPLIRVMAEGKDKNEIQSLADGIAAVIRKKLG